MYYEERLIDGVMCFRTDPKGKFEPYDLSGLSRRYSDMVENTRNLFGWINDFVGKARSVGFQEK